MSNFVPSADTLLSAAADYLADDLLPSLTGYHRFKILVAVNVLNTVIRELCQGSALDAAERDRLTALLGHDGANRDLNLELCDAIAEGRRTIGDPSLVAHIRETLRGALSINNPKWIVD